MVRKIRDMECPFCGSTEFVRGVRDESRYDIRAILPLRRTFSSKRQMLVCIFCRHCGTLVREYIRHPEYLEP